MKSKTIQLLGVFLLSVLVSFAGTSILKAQGFEDFSNLDHSTSSYIDSSFVGNDGITWTYKQSAGNQTINGKALTFGRNRTPDAELTSSLITGGIDSLKFNYKQTFSSNVNLNVYVNDVLVGNVTSSSETSVVKNAAIAVFVSEDAVIRFSNELNGAGQVTLDDISWGSFEGGVPVLTASTSELDGFSYDLGAGPSASQAFTVSGSSLPDSVSVVATGDFEVSLDDTSFASSQTILADSAGAAAATIYVRQSAGLDGGDTSGDVTVSAGDETSVSVTLSGFVTAPLTASLPYAETFASDLSGVYTYSVSGDTKEWQQGGSGDNTYASMNGFNSGETEEDWMILPGFDLSGTEGETLTFTTAYNFGNDDENNYLKLVYSTDYAGLGDPSAATWTELAYNAPTSSGYTPAASTVDLSSVDGSSVHLAFQYRYEAGSYRGWRVSNIALEEVNDPVLNVDSSGLSDLQYEETSGPSDAATIGLSGVALDGSDVVVTIPELAPFEVDGGSGYGKTATFTAFDGAAATFDVRLEAGLAPGNYSDTLRVSGGGAAEIAIELTGTVTALPDYEVLERFDNFPVTGGSYLDGTFDGVLSNTWTYVATRGDQEISGATPTIRNNTTASLSSTILGGISRFTFDYMQAFSSDVNMDVLINGEVVATLTSDDERGIVKNSGEILVEDVFGSFTIEFKQSSPVGGQTAIDNFYFDQPEPPAIAPPEFSVSSGTYFEDLYVSVSNRDSYSESAVIYYTIDGTDPDTTSTVFADSVLVADGNGAVTLKAFAVDGEQETTVSQATYTLPVNVADIQTLQQQETGGLYRVTGEATYLGGDSFRNTKFFQDTTGFGIQIDDNGGVITTSYTAGDNVAGLVGTLNQFRSQFQFVPAVDPGVAVSSGNTITPAERTLGSLTSADQATLVRISNVEFQEAGDAFGSGGSYHAIKDSSVADFSDQYRNIFGGSDVTGSTIPALANVTAVVQQINDVLIIAARTAADIEEVIIEEPTYTLTFNVYVNLNEDYDPDTQGIYISGDLVGWSEPGSDPNNELAADPNTEGLYSISFDLEPGTYNYKYFVVADGTTDWDNGEWPGDPNRSVTLGEQNFEQNDLYGVQPGQTISIADARTLPEGAPAPIQGIVNSNDYGFSVADYFVQDLTGGINITNFTQGGNRDGVIVQPGDEVKLMDAVRSDFNNMIEVVVEMEDIVSSGNPVPEPAIVTGSDLTADSPFQGVRVKLENVKLLAEDYGSWPTTPVNSGSGVNVRFETADADTFTVRIARNNSFIGANGAPIPTGPVNLSGSVGQFFATTQVFPFFEGDIEPVIMANYTDGWNMISLPTAFEHADYSEVFPAAAPNTLFSYPNNTYQSEDMLSNGVGYWAFMDSSSVQFEGEPIFSQEVALVEGWNMIGSVSVPAFVSDSDVITIPGTFYSYDGAYMPAAGTDPGKAYWIGASSDGTISLEAGAPDLASLASSTGTSVSDMNDLSAFNRIDVMVEEQSRSLYFGQPLEGTFHPLQLSLPPLPPAGSFDARISGGAWISSEEMIRVDLQQSSEEISVSVSGELATGNQPFQIVFMDGVNKLSSHTLESGEVLVVPATADHLIAGPEAAFAEELPETFSLSQNYPNPFNPVTTIQYALPEAADVQLELYNILGQRVAVLVSETLQAGYHTVSLDASGLSSGVYLYRITAGSFTQTRKLTLMK